MAEVAEPSIMQVRAAVEECKTDILGNIDTLTMKLARGMLEKHMGLPPNSLKPLRDKVAAFVDQLVARHKAAAEGGAFPAASSSELSADEQGDADDQENQTPPKRKRQQGGSDAKPRGKAKKAAAEPDAGKKPNKRLEALKAVCAKAGLRPSPHIYKQTDDDARIRALEEFLEKKGLSRHSTPSEIAAFKRSVERERDLEGIDMSNIVGSGSRRGRREAAAKPINYRGSYTADVGSGSGADSDDDAAQESGSQPADSGSSGSEEFRDSDASEQQQDDSDGAASPANGTASSPASNGGKATPKRAKALKKAAAAAAAEDDDGVGAAAAAEAEDPPDSVPPPARKRRAILSDSDDE